MAITLRKTSVTDLASISPELAGLLNSLSGGKGCIKISRFKPVDLESLKMFAEVHPDEECVINSILSRLESEHEINLTWN
ncbi:MAG: hypothetical protein PHH85_02070 [Candidatus Methanoperedens sp.]|nr:hypothetical protein [Candidatus Methanoperedens sp.]